MKLASVRSLSELSPVLKDPQAIGPDPAYWVFNNISEDKWANITVIAPGQYNTEFCKTFGHYHSTNVVETYQVLAGEGVMVLQRKIVEDGKLNNQKVESVYLVKAKAGDVIKIPPEYGHSWTNCGSLPLITLDDWRSGHQPDDYLQIERCQGMAYYLTNSQGEIKAIPNQNYQDLSLPQWITPNNFNNLSK